MIMNMLQYSIHYVGSWCWFAYAKCHMAWARWSSRCKAFVARKVRTIPWAKCKKAVIWQATINLFMSLDIVWWFHTRAVLCRLAKKVSARGFLWERKVWILFSRMDVHRRNLWQKVEKGKFTGREATTRFPWASCFEKLTHSVPETWGCMYDVLAQRN